MGFIEGEGCFSISFIRSKTQKLGYQIKPMFVIKLTESEKEVLEKIRIYLGNIGNIYLESSESNRRRGLKNSRDCAGFRVTKLEELQNLIKLLKNQIFISQRKEKDFKNWVKCIEMIENKEHLTKEGFLRIALIRDQIHTTKQSNKKGFCYIKNELEPCYMMKKENSIPENCSIKNELIKSNEEKNLIKPLDIICEVGEC